MLTFKGKTEICQGERKPRTDWKAIVAECTRMDRFIVEVRPYDEAKEISLEQMAWIHCDAGPIAVLADYQGVSYLDAQNTLKRKAGRQWFVVEATPDNWFNTPGNIYYECRNAFCDKIFYPNRFKMIDGKKSCPFCQLPNIHLIIIKSKTTLTNRQTSLWMQNILDFTDALGCPCQPPNKQWRESLCQT